MYFTLGVKIPILRSFTLGGILKCQCQPRDMQKPHEKLTCHIETSFVFLENWQMLLPGGNLKFSLNYTFEILKVSPAI